jgi:hypothetical protein
LIGLTTGNSTSAVGDVVGDVFGAGCVTSSSLPAPVAGRTFPGAVDCTLAGVAGAVASGAGVVAAAGAFVSGAAGVVVAGAAAGAGVAAGEEASSLHPVRIKVGNNAAKRIAWREWRDFE